jgi:hypothetical protein
MVNLLLCVRYWEFPTVLGLPQQPAVGGPQARLRDAGFALAATALSDKAFIPPLKKK